MSKWHERWRRLRRPEKKLPINERVAQMEGTLRECLKDYVGRPNTPDTMRLMQASIMHALRELLPDRTEDIDFEISQSEDPNKLVIVPLNGFTEMLLNRLNTPSDRLF